MLSILRAEGGDDAFLADASAAKCAGQRGEVIVPAAFLDLFTRSFFRLLFLMRELGANLTDLIH